VTDSGYYGGLTQMKLNPLIITLAAAAAVPVIAAGQVSAQTGCESVAVQMKTVGLATPRSGSLVNFTGSGGNLDPVPLLEASFTVSPSSRSACVALTFSAQSDFGDNYGVYQASIDDVPMTGHASLAPEYGFTTPIVFDAVNQGTYLPVSPYIYPNYSNSRFVSYTFFATVTPGTHTMRIKVAGCCSSTPGGIASVFVRSATAVLRW
jgi:hypothetical protein